MKTYTDEQAQELEAAKAALKSSQAIDAANIEVWKQRVAAAWTERDALQAELDNIKQVEFPKRLRNVTRPLIEQRDALQAKLDVLAGQEKFAPALKQVFMALAGLLEQVETFVNQHGEADFETGEALKAIEDNILVAEVAAGAAPQRCPLCNYQHGHQIGCENNPVDIALKASPQQKCDRSCYLDPWGPCNCADQLDCDGQCCIKAQPVAPQHRGCPYCNRPDYKLPTKAQPVAQEPLDPKWNQEEGTIQMLLEALKEATEEISDWGAYASEYFQKKHDLAGTVAKFRAAIKQAEGPAK